jgi:hypothetical protein
LRQLPLGYVRTPLLILNTCSTDVEAIKRAMERRPTSLTDEEIECAGGRDEYPQPVITSDRAFLAAVLAAATASTD